MAPSPIAIAEAAPIGIFRADCNGDIVYINRALERISGVRASRALGRSWLRASPAEGRERAEREWKAAIAAGEDWSSEFRFNHPDGTVRYAAILMTAEPALDGASPGFIGFVTDLTERHNAEAELRRRERLFRLLAENATDIIVRLDLDDHVIYASPAMGELTGFPAETTVGMNPISWMHPDDAAAAKEESRRLKAGEIDQAVIEYRTSHKDGHWIWMEARSRLVRDSRGNPTEVISVVRNISIRKQLETDLIAAREAEKQASAAQNRFLATMSHEIRTPISGVIGMIDLLMDARSEEEQQRYRSALAASATTLLRVVDDVLDYSKLSTVGITLDPTPFDVFVATHNVVDLYRAAAEAKGLALGLRFETSRHCAVGDATRIRQVLGNLLSNAIKFTEQGRVDVEVRATGNRWEFAVADTGIGMTGDEQSRLFAAFAQANPSITGRFGGTGLGLAITQLIVGAMGGALSVTSEPGAGARFAFKITLKNHVETIDPKMETGRGPPRRSLALLVAEDNPVNQLYLTSLLERRGHRVKAVADGRDAVAAARAESFDAILLDLHMPDMSGDAAARAIRQEHGADCPMLVLVSAATDVGSGADWPFDSTLPKPIRIEQLEHQLEAIVDRSPSGGAATQSLSAADLDGLAQLFRADLARRLPLIEAAIEAADEDILRREGHAITGAAALIGNDEIAGLAKQVERASGAERLAAARSLRRASADFCAPD